MNALRILRVGEEPPPLEPPSSVVSAPVIQGSPAGKREPKGKTGERFAVLNGFVDSTLPGLARSEIAVWLILFRDTRDGLARTSIANLARRAGCDRRTALRAVHRLEGRGLIKIVQRGGLGLGPSRYRVEAFARDG